VTAGLEGAGQLRVYADTTRVLADIRRQKSLNGWKTKTPVNVIVVGEKQFTDTVQAAEGDLKAAVSASSLTYKPGPSLEVVVEAAELVEGGTEPRP
jgi:hypothetical protein